MRIPPLEEYTSADAFLRDLVAANQGAAYSYRAIARRLRWPSSYLSDLFAGRKRLSPMRALQLARSLGLGEKDVERLLLLAMIDGSDDAVAEYLRGMIGRVT